MARAPERLGRWSLAWPRSRAARGNHDFDEHIVGVLRVHEHITGRLARRDDTGYRDTPKLLPGHAAVVAAIQPL